MMYYWNSGSGWGCTALNMVLGALVVAVMVVAAVWIARSHAKAAATHMGGSVGSILDERFARAR